ncbi:MAG: hypothetical protein R2828_35275 [Saprospiraceae bacterium]
MCYCVFLASDQPLPIRQIPEGQQGFRAWTLRANHPVQQWFSKPYIVEFGSTTGCACALYFQLNFEMELEETPEFSEDLTPEMWKAWVEEYELKKQALCEYFNYLQTALAESDLEWYCCWDGDWDIPPIRREAKTLASLSGEPDFQKDYPLECGLFIDYQKK